MTLNHSALAGIAVAIYASPAFAHHSFAMFDADSKMTVEGIVKEFQWTNPHAWIMLTVANAKESRSHGRSNSTARAVWCGRAGSRRR